MNDTGEKRKERRETDERGRRYAFAKRGLIYDTFGQAGEAEQKLKGEPL